MENTNSHISKTTFVSKDFNTVCRFINMKKVIPDVSTQLSMTPDANGYYTAVVHYNKPSRVLNPLYA